MLDFAFSSRLQDTDLLYVCILWLSRYRSLAGRSFLTGCSHWYCLHELGAQVSQTFVLVERGSHVCDCGRIAHLMLSFVASLQDMYSHCGSYMLI